jgi:hypothetical protein
MAGEDHKATADRLITDVEIDTIASEMAMLKDVNDLLPGESKTIDGVLTNYANTVDLYRTAAEVWRRKAAIFAEQFDFESEGSVYQTSQKYKMAMQQAARYAGMAHSLTVNVRRNTEEDAAVDEEDWWEAL